MTQYIVARAADIEPGGRMIVELEGRSIGVFNIDGEYFALLNRCPHAAAPLCEAGPLFGLVTADRPSEKPNYDRRGEFIRCPWHSWEFDIKTGQSSFDPSSFGVRSYEVEVIAGSPEALIDGDSQGRQPGPYVLENFTVSVNAEDMVVVETRPRRRQRDAPRATAVRTTGQRVGE
jgi:3-phenylpropionate/trans-cinnamate dioxygenase ferredoxin subunit